MSSGNRGRVHQTRASALKGKPSAITLPFPDLQTIPKELLAIWGIFQDSGGVALGPMLQEKFGIPVFINNDGDLFAFGEAIAGFLPRKQHA